MLNVLYQVCVLRADQKNNMAAMASDWLRHIYDFSYETAEWNSAKLDRKQDLNVLYQVCVYRDEKKIKMATLANLSKKVAHCTQVHVMWPFGPLVFSSNFEINWSLKRPIVSSIPDPAPV